MKEVTDIEFRIKKKKYIPLDDEIYRRIIPLAKSLHKSSEELINEWIIEILRKKGLYSVLKEREIGRSFQCINEKE